jgi:hypothetical protein
MKEVAVFYQAAVGKHPERTSPILPEPSSRQDC